MKSRQTFAQHLADSTLRKGQAFCGMAKVWQHGLRISWCDEQRQKLLLRDASKPKIFGFVFICISMSEGDTMGSTLMYGSNFLSNTVVELSWSGVRTSAKTNRRINPNEYKKALDNCPKPLIYIHGSASMCFICEALCVWIVLMAAYHGSIWHNSLLSLSNCFLKA